jgi:hypothetical protein
MKKVIGFVISIALLSSCSEVGPNIQPPGNTALSDTTYIDPNPAVAQQKAVLIEEFTGVQCSNCPLGHAIVKQLVEDNPGRVVGVSMHSISILSDPLPSSSQDLRNEEAEIVGDDLVVDSKPLASIDRTLNGGFFVSPRFAWGGYVNTQLNLSTPVNVTIETAYDAGEREATITITVQYTSAVNVKNKLSVYLLEDSIETTQLQPDNSEIENYLHKDVLRDIVSAPLGDILPVDGDLYATGRTFKRVYRRALEPQWKEEQVKVVAFVHAFENGSKQVYQTAEVKLGE